MCLRVPLSRVSEEEAKRSGLCWFADLAHGEVPGAEVRNLLLARIRRQNQRKLP